MQVRICPECKKRIPVNNLVCNQCKVDLSLVPVEVIEDEDSTNSGNIRLYKICPVCGNHVTVKDEKEKVKECPICGSDAIKRLAEDSVRREITDKIYQNDQPELKEATTNEENNLIQLINKSDGMKINLKKGIHVIGAYGDCENEYFWNLQYVGGKHAIIDVSEKGVFIEDNHSRNFTYINKRRIFPNKKEEIKDGDIVTMADQDFEVKICK